MALTVGELNAILTVDDRNFEAALKEAKKNLEKAAASADDFGDEAKQSFDKATKAIDKTGDEAKRTKKDLDSGASSVSKFGQTIGRAFKVAAVIAVGKAVADVTMEMANLALEAQESAAAFEITFGGATQEVTRYVNQMAHAFGMTKAEMQQQMAVTGSIIQGMGFTSDAAADMSTNILSLSGDLAAFMNIQEGAVVPAQAITKALTGEREMLKSMGIVLRQTEIEQKAMNLTGKASVGLLTDQEKASASLILIEEKMGHIKGQLGREAAGAANQMRMLRAEFKEAKTEVGANLLPLFSELIPTVRALMPAFKTVMTSLADLVSVILQAVMPAVRPLNDIIEALAPIVQLLASVFAGALSGALKGVIVILDVTLIPLLEALSQAAEFVMNAFGLLTAGQEDYLRSAKSAEGILFRLNEAIAAGVPPQEAYNIALQEGKDIGIEQQKVYDDMTQAAFGFSRARQDEIRETIAAKKAQLEHLESQKAGSYQTWQLENGITRVTDEIRALEGELTSNIYKMYSYEHATGAASGSTDGFTESTEENSDALQKNSIELDKNTQRLLNQNAIANESIAAMIGLTSAIQNVMTIEGRQAAEQEKLNKLYAKRAELQKIINEEAGKGEVQTALELAQISKLQKEEEGLLKQQQNGLDLKLEIASAELDLADAIMQRDEKGEEADARDELSIKQQQVRLTELKNRQATSKDVTIELANVQQNLADAISNSTMSTRAYMQASEQMKKLDSEIATQTVARNEAAIDTDAERLELTEARLNMQAALLTAQDRGVMDEARETLKSVMGMNNQEINALFSSLGLDLSAFDRFGSYSNSDAFRSQLLTEDRDNLGGNDDSSGGNDDSGSNNDSSGNNNTKPPEVVLGGSPNGASLSSGRANVNGINLTSLENAALSDVAKKILPMLDLADQASLRSSAVQQFLAPTVENKIYIDSSLDAEARADRNMQEINDRLQVNNRFRII
jgi:hypothetical protein